jgi:hypothetical protein
MNFLRHSPISNLEKQQRLTDMLSELILKENIIGTTARTIEDIEKEGYDIVEYKQGAENHIVRFIIGGLIDDTGNMVRPYLGNAEKMGTESEQFIERAIVTLSQYLYANPKVGLEEIKGGYIPDKFIVNDLMVSAEGDTFMVQSEVNIPALLRTD